MNKLESKLELQLWEKMSKSCLHDLYEKRTNKGPTKKSSSNEGWAHK